MRNSDSSFQEAARRRSGPDKRHVTYETGHAVPRKEFIRESLDWLDRYFGPVRK